MRSFNKFMLSCFLATASLVVGVQMGWADFFIPDVKVNDVTTNNQSGEGRWMATLGDTVYVVWADPRTDTAHIYFARSTNRGATFGLSKKVDTNPDSMDQIIPCITVDPSGNIYIAWIGGNTATMKELRIYFAKSTNGGDNFSSSIMVDNSTLEDSVIQVFPSIAVDGDSVYIAWMDNRNYDYNAGEMKWDVHFARSLNGGTGFESPIQVNDASCTSVYGPDETMTAMAVDALHNIYLVWQDGRNGNADIYFDKSTNGGVNFGTNVPVNDITSPAGDSLQCYPSIAVGYTDTVYVAWEDYRMGENNRRVYFNKSLNGGTTFGTNVPASDTIREPSAGEPSIAISSDKIYIAYIAQRDGQERVRCASSCDNGITWRSGFAVSDTYNIEFNYPSCAMGPGDSLYVVWGDSRLSGIEDDCEIYFSKGEYPGFSGHITENTTWGQDIFISGDVWVDSAVTLTIASGVTVTFDARSDDQYYFYPAADTSDTVKCSIWILDTTASLSAQGGGGAKADSIVFTSNGAPKDTADWGMIAGFGDMTFEYCDIGYNYTMVGLKDFNVSNCKVHDCKEDALGYHGAEKSIPGVAILTHNTIYNANAGMWLGARSHTITHNTIYNCETGIGLNDTGTSVIDSNTITNCSNAGIQLEDSVTPTITRNQITSDSTGIGIGDNANPLIGGSLANANDIYNNFNWNIQNDYSDTVKAEYNYWGFLTNSGIAATMGGNRPDLVDYIPWTNAARDSVYNPYLGPVWVATTGDDITGNGSPGNPFRTIGKGLSEAGYGDTVKVKPGTYDAGGGEFFPLNMPNGVALISEKGRDSTTINGSSRVIECNNVDNNTVISGFTITGGNEPGGKGAGILCNNASPNIISNTFFDNIAFQGAGICCDMNSNAAIDDNIFISNNADQGAGIYINFSAPHISGNTFTNNFGPLAGGYTEGVIYCDLTQPGTIISENTITDNDGRGIYCNNGSVGSITFNTITGDTIPTNGVWYGAGIYCNNNSLPNIEGNTLSLNRARNGGGLSCDGGATPTIKGNTITNNKAEPSGGGGGSGGGIFVMNASPMIDSNTVTENNARFGGGIMWYGGGGGGEISRNVLKSNTADTLGGGILCYQSSPNIYENSIIENSVVYNGGAICCWDANPTIEENVIERNIASNLGGGIYCFNNSSPTIVENTIVGNIGPYDSGICSADNSNPNIQRNAIMDNACGVYFLPTSGTGGFVEKNNIYYNTYQPAPTDYDIINATSGTVNFLNCWWGTTDSASIDENIQGDVAFMPYRLTPFFNAPGEPSAVDSVRIYDDVTYSNNLINVNFGDTMFIELGGTDWRSGTRDPAMVILKSQTDTFGIGLALVETGTATGIYRGYAIVDTVSNDLYNHISADTNGFIVVCSNIDTLCDTVYMPITPPVMSAEPTYTQDTSNLVYWTGAAVEYYAECDTNNNFTSIHSFSGWITDTSYTFTPLSDGIKYYYRVKIRNAALVESGWSNIVFSTQDTTSPTITDLTPPDSSYLDTTIFTISAKYADSPSSGIDTNSVVIKLDGADVTPQATVTDSMVRYTPASPLSDAIHTVLVKVSDNVGNPADSAIWSFEVDTTQPLAPTLISPNACWLNDTSVAFEWTAVTKGSQKSEIRSQKIGSFNHGLLTPRRASLNSETSLSQLRGEPLSILNFKSAPIRYVLQIDTNLTFPVPVVDTTTLTNDTLSFSDAQYFWRVGAFDSAGNIGNFSDPFWFGVDTTVPYITNVFPPANTLIADSLPTIKAKYIDELSEIDTTEIVLEVDGNPVSATITDSMVSYTPTTALADTIHSVTVHIKDNAGNPASMSWSFEVDANAPATPTLVQPTDGMWQDSLPVHFEWTEVTKSAISKKKWDADFRRFSGLQNNKASPIKYVIQIDTTASFTTPVLTDTTTDTDYDTTLFEGYFYWKIMAYDSAGNPGSWTAIDSFGVDTTNPSVPILISPLDSAYLNDSTVHFAWDEATDNLSGVSHYQLQVDTTNGFVDPLIDTILSDTVCLGDFDDTEDWLKTTPHLRWRVRTVDKATNKSEWSAVRIFGIDTETPDKPTLVQPIDGVWQDSLPVYFEWTAVAKLAFLNSDKLTNQQTNKLTPIPYPLSPNKASPIKYVIQVDTTASFTTPVLTDTVTDTNYDTTLFEDYFYWKIMAYDSAGNPGDWTTIDSFGVDTTSPVIDSTTVWEDTVSFWGPFPVETKITDNFVFNSPVMFYRTSVDTNWVADTMHPLGDGWYIDSIPVQTPQDSIIVDYYLTAEDYAGNNSRDPGSGLYSFVLRLKPSAQEDKKVPDKFILFSPTPNPSLRNTQIKYGLPEKANITLSIYDISGRLVKTFYSGTRKEGYYTVNLNCKEFSKGIYFIQFKSGKFTDRKKFIILQ